LRTRSTARTRREPQRQSQTALSAPLLTQLRAPQEKPSSKEQELVFEAVTATMKQLKGSYSVISLISQAGVVARPLFALCA
jgi:glutamine phosphoribosylpyrophosphate amidotransferase